MSPQPAARTVVAVLVEGRYVAQAQPAGAVTALRAAGCEVRVVVADDVDADLCRPDWCDGVDVVLPRGRSNAVLGLLRTAELCGAAVVLSAAAVARVVDKASMATTLAGHGVPTPRTWLGSPQRLARRRDLLFPLVLKPVTGDNARGLHVVRSRAELARVHWPEPVALAQPFHRGDGRDLKVYVVGDRVWAVRRPSPIAVDGSPRTVSDPGEEVPVPAPLAGIARRCARIFDLPLLGLDVVGGPDRALVVEVNDYPTYRGVLPQADPEIARLVLDRAARAARPPRSVTGARIPALRADADRTRLVPA